MTAGIDLHQEGDKVVRTIVLAQRTMDGNVMILREIKSVLPVWPTGHGQ